MNSRDAYHTSIMQHIADFLSARDICAMSAICARNRCMFAHIWGALRSARFPYKKFSPNCDCSPVQMREFVLSLEKRAEDGHARTFLASLTHFANSRVICGDNTNSRACDRDLFIDQHCGCIRGDIIIDATTHVFIFDGHRAHYVDHGVFEHDEGMGTIREDSMDLSSVFNIPYEFPITYYDHIRCSDIHISCRIDARVLELKSDDDRFKFEYEGIQYEVKCAYSIMTESLMIRNGASFMINSTGLCKYTLISYDG